MKRAIDVEMLVRWACERMPSRRPSRATSPAWMAGSSPAMTGEEGHFPGTSNADCELVGKWRAPASYPAILPMFARGFAGSAAPRPASVAPRDRADVEAVDNAIRALGLPARNLAAPDSIAHNLGMQGIDFDGAFAAARSNMVNLVLAHGRLGARPVAEHAIAVLPRRAPNGQPGVWRIETVIDEGAFGKVEREAERPAPAARRGRYADGAYCRIDYEPDPQIVANDRAEYAAWRMGLDLLALALAGRLELFEVAPAAAPRAPWMAGDPGPSPFPLPVNGERVAERRVRAKKRAARPARMRAVA